MKNLDQKIKVVSKVLVFGWGITCAKLYSEMRYYQGRIDANNETTKRLQEVKDELYRRYGIEKDEEGA